MEALKFPGTGAFEMNFEKMRELGLHMGFTHVVPLKVETILLQKAVRDMCAANQCGQYGKNWSCPPACGSLEECRAKVASYREGILVQTVGKLEDSFDYEGMTQLEKRHKDQFSRFQDLLYQDYPFMLPLGAGCCTRCSRCTYPDASCRLPHKRISSMEAYGMMVMQVCRDNHLDYYYGPDTLAFTGCFLLK